jgi:hypothetical protein
MKQKAVAILCMAAVSVPMLTAMYIDATTVTGADRAGTPHRPVATYSIVARDSVTGEIGVAVQSHWFSVGPLVPWAPSRRNRSSIPRTAPSGSI